MTREKTAMLRLDGMIAQTIGFEVGLVGISDREGQRRSASR